MYDMIIHQDLPGTIKLKCSSKHRVPKHGPLKANGFKVRPTMCSYHVYLPCFTICHMHLPYLFTLFYHGFTMVLPCFTIILIIPHLIPHEFLSQNLPLRLTWAPARPAAPNPESPESRGPLFDVMSKKWCLKGSNKKWTLHDYMTLHWDILEYPRI
jgi:hypothetical protein